MPLVFVCVCVCVYEWEHNCTIMYEYVQWNVCGFMVMYAFIKTQMLQLQLQQQLQFAKHTPLQAAR